MQPIYKFTERNIRAIYEREKAELERAPRAHQLAHKVAIFAGTVAFIITHIIAFGGWIGFNLAFPDLKIDPYPFILLTTVVSLESIFLSAFVMLSQNELARLAEQRHNLDLQINLLAEKESTEMIKFLIKVGRKLGMSEADWAELEQLTADTDAEEVLEKIAEIEEH